MSSISGTEYLDNPTKAKGSMHVEHVTASDKPSPPVRTPSSRLSEKIQRDSVTRSGRNQTAPLESFGEKNEDEEESIGPAGSDGLRSSTKSDDEDTKVGHQKSAKFSEKPERSTNHVENQKTGAFYVSSNMHGDIVNSNTSPQEVDAPTVPSVIIEPTDLPIAAALVDDDDDDAEPVMASKLDDVNVNLKSRKVRLGIALLLVILIGAIVGGVLGAQKSKSDVMEQCIVEDPTKLGDGVCDGGEYNTDKCQWDKGDCAIINSYPDCPISPADSAKLGDGSCDGLPYFSPECGLDAGDCANCTSPPPQIFKLDQIARFIGDGGCWGPLNHAGCGFDGGDCNDFNSKYPDCRQGDHSCSSFNSSFPGCVVVYPEFVGDNVCDEGGYNNVLCNYDGGDCKRSNRIFNRKYPDCLGGDHSCSTFNATFPGCIVEDPSFVGDGECDGSIYNIPECNWDGGDCDYWNDLYPDCRREDSICTSWKEKYPGCDVESPESVGDGYCDGTPYNNTECQFDGGDCLGNFQW